MTCSDVIGWLLATAKLLVSQFSIISFGLGGAATFLVLWMVFRRRTGAKSASIGLPFGLGSATFDLTPKGRNESSGMDWVKRHDEYDQAPIVKASCCG